MGALLGALAVFFLLEVAVLLSPWPVASRAELVVIAACSVGWGLLFISAGVQQDLLMALATAGATSVLHAAFRLVRAWADRVEVANALPIHRGQM